MLRSNQPGRRQPLFPGPTSPPRPTRSGSPADRKREKPSSIGSRPNSSCGERKFPGNRETAKHGWAWIAASRESKARTVAAHQPRIENSELAGRNLFPARLFSAADGSLKRQMFLLFQTPWQIIDARLDVSAFDVLGMKGNPINHGTRAKSNAGKPSLIDWGGIGDVAGELVSCLLEWAFDVLL